MRHSERMIAEALVRGDTVAVAYWERIRAKVDAAPPLSDEQRDRLRVLLRPAPVVEPQPRRAPNTPAEQLAA